MSVQASLTAIAICQIIVTAMIFIVAAGLLIGILMLKKFISDKIDQILDRIQPILDQTKDIAEQAKETAEKVSEKVDSIMTKAEDTASKVTERMDNVTAKVEESVSPQAASIAGYVAAGLKALQLVRDISAVRTSSSEHRRQEPEKDAGPYI
jgi:predicted PurR-regulated permease PerM